MKTSILFLIFAFCLVSFSQAQDVTIATTAVDTEEIPVAEIEEVPIVEENETELEIETENEENVGGYEPVDQADWVNIEYQEFLNIGANKVIRIGMQANKIAPSNNNWRVTAINSIETQVVSGINYRYNLTLLNEDNTTLIRTNFVVYHQAWTNTTVMTRWYYIVLPQYVPLRPLSLVNTDKVINALMVYGAHETLKAGQEDGKIPNDERFFLRSLSNADVRYYYPNYYNYVFTVGMRSADGSTVKATYRVDYNATLDAAKLNGYSYVYNP